jgi:hypothetical protein
MYVPLSVFQSEPVPALGSVSFSSEAQRALKDQKNECG